MSEDGNVTIESAVHMAVCQSINLDFDEIEEREEEVLALVHHTLRQAIERAEERVDSEALREDGYFDYTGRMKQILFEELGLDK